MRRLILLILSAIPFAAFSLGGPFPAWAEPPPEGQVEVAIESDPPIFIRADEIEADPDKGRTNFIGRVSISRAGETVAADRAIWHDPTRTAEVSGAVRIENKDFIAMAERAVINMDLQLAKIYGGRAFFPARNYYLSGALIERQGEKTIYIKDGQATTCDGPAPAWTIRAENLTVTQEGYATATGVVLDTKYFPAFYSPFLIFPVKSDRQTGFLLPGLTNSSRDGFTAALPFFWATGENHDLTITPVWRSKRGLAPTLEGRYHLMNGRGAWLGTWLDDQAPRRFSYQNGASDWTDQRYWLRTQNNWQTGDWDLNLDLDLASDPLYLDEFKDDADGFNYSQRLMAQDFGRTFNEYLDPLRQSVFFAQRSGYDTYFRGMAEYNDNLYSQNNRDTLRRLPSLDFNIVGRPWPAAFDFAKDWGASARFSLGARYDYYDRNSDDQSVTNETGHRLHLAPSLTWSQPVGNLASLYLTGDLDLNSYAAQGYRPSALGPDDPAARHDNWENTLSAGLSAGLATTLSKVYDGGPGSSLATRHQMTPSVTFNFVEAPAQDDLPYWDMYDRRLSRRTIRYGLLNTLVAKRPAADVKKNGRTAEAYEYHQFLKVGFWSSYEFKSNLEWAEDPWARYYTDDYFDRGAGPFEVEIEAFPNEYFSARLRSAVDGRTGLFTSQDISFRAQDPRGDSLTVTYDFDKPSTAMGTWDYARYEEVRADLRVKVNPEWSLGFSTRYDINNDSLLESYAQVNYAAQCYGFSLLYSDREGDSRISFLVDLLGLGSSGSHSGPTLATAPTP